MHSREAIDTALSSAARGSSASEIARVLGIPRRTVSGWLSGQTPVALGPAACARCGHAHELVHLTDAYVYLLGLYLGDGCISPHHRGVFKFRLFLDASYPLIVEEAVAAVAAVRRGRAAAVAKPPGCVEVYAFWRSWPCLFPQHGPGKKHERPIELEPWQRKRVTDRPQDLLRGLIQSDGCRFINTGRNWRAPRYAFSNHSDDIHGIFRDACDQIGVRWTASGPYTTYVSRQADVAVLDTFIGPKR